MTIVRQDSDTRIGIVNATKTPLGVFSLALLVVESLFGSLILATSGTNRTFLLISAVGILVLIIILVAIIAVWKPEALWGKRYFGVNIMFADAIAGNIHLALNASLVNLKKEVDRQQAWVALTDIFSRSDPGFPSEYLKFREALADGIKRRVGDTKKLKETYGAIM